MPMLRSGRGVLTSFPIPVRFAGFESTTAQLQHMGWSLSLQQDPVRAQCRLAMEYEKAGLFAMTSPMDFMAMELFFAMERGNTEPLRALGFDVIYVGNAFQVYRMPVTGPSFLADFQPIDAEPQSAVIERPEDFSLFRKLDKTKDVLIDPNDVPGLMEMILKAQKPEQDMIRARAKSRENLATWRASQQGRYDPQWDFKPPIEIKAQLLTLVG